MSGFGLSYLSVEQDRENSCGGTLAHGTWDDTNICWHEIWPGGLWPPWASPAPMLRRRPSSGTSTRLRAPVVILGFTEYGLFSVYKFSIFRLLYR